jgi:cytidylate kinase
LTEAKQKRVVVAIDGPAGAGKSTIAKRIAERLGFTYIDTGAMYRAVALWALRQKVDFSDMHRLEQLAIAARIELEPGRIRLNGEEVTEAIRTPEVSNGASKVAVIPGVRRRLEDLRAQGEAVTAEQLAAQMKERDQRDSTRADAPLAQAPDAAYLDSTPLAIEEVVEAILKIVRQRVTNGKDFS